MWKSVRNKSLNLRFFRIGDGVEIPSFQVRAVLQECISVLEDLNEGKGLWTQAQAQEASPDFCASLIVTSNGPPKVYEKCGFPVHVFKDSKLENKYCLLCLLAGALNFSLTFPNPTHIQSPSFCLIAMSGFSFVLCFLFPPWFFLHLLNPLIPPRVMFTIGFPHFFLLSLSAHTACRGDNVRCMEDITVKEIEPQKKRIMSKCESHFTTKADQVL